MPPYLSFILCTAFSILVHAEQLCIDTINIAGGGLPSNAIPSIASEGGIKEIQLAQFYKNLEASFFSAGWANISMWGVEGCLNNTVEIVRTAAAQEEVHLESLKTLLNTYHTPLIPPCNYTFPVSTTREFFQLADIIGSAGIGATIGLLERLALTDPMLARLISSMLAVESRHDAFFRYIQGQKPNPAPFDTGIPDIWAYNLALSFIVPGSCPIDVPIPILPKLSVAQVSAAPYSNSTNSTLQWEFTWDPAQIPFVAEDGKQLLVGWVNQVNIPVYTHLNITKKGKGTASAPQRMKGATFASITTQTYANVNDLAFGSVAGPVVVSLPTY